MANNTFLEEHVLGSGLFHFAFIYEQGYNEIFLNPIGKGNRPGHIPLLFRVDTKVLKESNIREQSRAFCGEMRE